MWSDNGWPCNPWSLRETERHHTRMMMMCRVDDTCEKAIVNGTTIVQSIHAQMVNTGLASCHPTIVENML
jgi:hypothetical protein